MINNQLIPFDILAKYVQTSLLVYRILLQRYVNYGNANKTEFICFKQNKLY